MNRLRCASLGVLLGAALLAGSVGSIGCGAQRMTSTNSPGYITLALSTGALTLLPGQSATLTVKTQATRSLSGPITLSLRGAQGTSLDGLSYAFEPEVLQLASGAMASSQLRVAALPTAEPRDYKLEVVGAVDGTEETAALSITTSGTGLGWMRQAGTAGSETLAGMAADSQGGVYVVGYTSGAFDGRPVTGEAGTYDAFVLKYRRSGALEWVRQFGTPKSDVPLAIAVDDFDNVYIAGNTYGTFTGQVSMGKRDGFVAKVGATGNILWLKQVGTSELDQLTAISVDKQGQVVVAGETEGGFMGFANKGRADLFAMRLSAEGSVLWTQQIGSDQNEVVSGVALDGGEGGSGAAYVVGGTEGVLLDAVTQGLQDGFLIKLGADGKVAWTRQVGTSGSDQLTAVVLDAPSAATGPAASVYVGGWTRGSFSGQLQLGGQDALLLRYSADGTRTLGKQFGTSFFDTLAGLTWVGGKLYSVGSTKGAFSGQDALGAQDAFVARHNTDGSIGWLHQFGTDQVEYGIAVAGRDDVLYVGGYTYGAFDGFMLQGDSDGYVIQILPRPSP